MVNENEMEFDKLNEWDGNEWDELWDVKWMRWKWLDKYVTMASIKLV